MVSYRAFIFHIFIPLGKTPPIIPKSRSYVTVKYQGYSFLKKKKMAIAGVGRGGFMFHKHVLFIVYIDYGLKFSLTIHYCESRTQHPSMGPPCGALFKISI